MKFDKFNFNERSESKDSGAPALRSGPQAAAPGVRSCTRQKNYETAKLSGGRAEFVVEVLNPFRAERQDLEVTPIVSGRCCIGVTRSSVREKRAEKFGNGLDARKSGEESKFMGN